MNKETNSLAYADDWEFWLGKEIIKYSGNPFKSGKKIGIPVDIEINPHSQKLAFRMQEDNTLVDCFRTHLNL